MASIAELSTDLINRLLVLEELSTLNAVSSSIVDDPQSTHYQNIPIPFCGVRFMAERNLNDNPNVKRQQPIESIFSISIHVLNGDDDTLNNQSYPFLDKVRETIEGNYTSDTAYAWQYRNGKIAFVDETRLQYIQYYSVITPK